jgi:hypothetical protein
LVTAIAGAETTFGHQLCAEFNAWNWFWKNPDQCQDNPEGSWEEGIQDVTRQMWLYFTRDKLTTISDIGKTYCKEGCEHWVPNVTQFYQVELDGDTADLGFSNPEPPISPPGTPRGWLGSSVIDNVIYLIGGGTCEGCIPSSGFFGQSETSRVEAYNPAANILAEKTPLQIARWSLTMATVSGKIYAIGGTAGCCSQPIADVEEYDPASNSSDL